MKLPALFIVALGAWLIANPLTFGYEAHSTDCSDIVSGILLILFGLIASPLSIWAAGLVGVWLQIAPLVFWAPHSSMYINDTLIGALAIVLAFFLNRKKETASSASIPTGWSYNPSGWSHRVPTALLAMLCWFFARYMASFQLGYNDQVWDPFFADGTLRVISSKISRDFPVSDAGLGAMCYTLESLLGWQGSTSRWASMPWLVCAFAFLVIPVGIVSVTLIILQPVIVGAWCSWCLATAVCMLLMIVLTAGELAATLQFLLEMKRKGASVWKVFWKGGKAVSAESPAKPRRKGISLPWTLVASFALGIWLMASPSVLGISSALATGNFILGPLIAAFSIASLAEVFRVVRFINILFGVSLLVISFSVTGASTLGAANNLIVGALIIALAFPKGKISERYGPWERLIF